MTIVEALGYAEFLSKKSKVCPYCNETFEKSYELYDDLEKNHILSIMKDLNDYNDKQKRDTKKPDEGATTIIHGEPDEVESKEPSEAELMTKLDSEMPEGEEANKNPDIAAGLEVGEIDEDGELMKSKRGRGMNGPSVYQRRRRAALKHVKLVNETAWTETYEYKPTEEQKEREKKQGINVDEKTYKFTTYHRLAAKDGDEVTPARAYCVSDNLTHFPPINYSDEKEKNESISVMIHAAYYKGKTGTRRFIPNHLKPRPYKRWAKPESEAEKERRKLRDEAIAHNNEYPVYFDATIERIESDKVLYEAKVQKLAETYAAKMKPDPAELDPDAGYVQPEYVDPRTEAEKNKDEAIETVRRDLERERSEKHREKFLDNAVKEKDEPIKVIENGQIKVLMPGTDEYNNYKLKLKIRESANEPESNLKVTKPTGGRPKKKGIMKFNYDRDVDDVLKEIIEHSSYQGTVGKEYKCPFGDNTIFVNANGLGYHILQKHANEVEEIILDAEDDN